MGNKSSVDFNYDVSEHMHRIDTNDSYSFETTEIGERLLKFPPVHRIA
jgi:hypothetical protein